MTRTCTICTHPQRDDIEKAILDGVPYRTIAAQYSISTGSIGRHKGAHLPATVAQAQALQAEVIRADDLLGQVQDLQQRALAILTRAEENGKDGLALQAVREVARVLELQGKLLGQVQTQPQTQIALVLSGNVKPGDV